MATETLSVSARSSASVVTLNRPELRNAISLQMMNELIVTLEQSVADGCRAVVITGGEKFFSSGRDLKEASSIRSSADQAHVRRTWLRLTETIEELACPV